MKNIYSISENCLHMMIRLPLAYRSLLLVLLLFISGQYSNAQTAGPFNSGTGTNVTGIGSVAWATPNNIVVSGDGAYATASLASTNSTSNYLQGSNYGFSIPTGAIINGFEVTINRMTTTNGGRAAKDQFVSMVKNGVVIGTNKAAATAYTSSLVVATYGSSTDTWGTTWTPADVNQTNFGAVLSAISTNSSPVVSVDYIRIKVYYTTITFSPS